ncbi:hypothetical protein BGZ65_003949 [Modicella reniformis]|uniref:Uncharacterized protein n=1 Tax=Modicella reniformis TaxID=1440133 RepID=A0A9P6M2W4_9FUNG|nr:hypothetical protein BGZ65_003949 [Modicella reniformis]
MFNLCRINKYRREEAAQAGIVPHLLQVAESSSPLKQLALRILCDMAHAGHACRNILWNNDCLRFYLRLFKDPYWQVNAMDAVLVWLQDETADVEQILLQQSSLNLFAQSFLTAKANSFENILEPLYKIIRISPDVARGIAVPALFRRLLDRLGHPKAVVRLNLLRILRAIFDVHPERIQLVVRYRISDVVVKIAESDSAVLVKELAKEILDAFEESDSEAALSSNEDDDHDGKSNGTNGYNSFVSSDEFFGLRYLRSLTPTPEDLHKRREKPGGGGGGTQLQRLLFAGKLAEKSLDRQQQQQDVEDLFQKEVDDLDIRTTSIDPRRSPHQPGFGLEGDPTLALQTAQLRHRWTTKLVISDEDNSSGSEEEHFVTSRGWAEGDKDNNVEDEDEDEEDEDEEEEEEDDEDVEKVSTVRYDPVDLRRQVVADPESTTVKISRPFGHQKSRSLGEILEEDFERSNRMLESVHSDDLSESMVLRRGLPKISLELLDIGRFPAWDKRVLEAGYDNDEEDDSDGGDVNMSSWSDKQNGRRLVRPRSTSFQGVASSTSEELTKILEEVQRTRWRPRASSSSSISTSSSSASHYSSSKPMIRSADTPISSIRVQSATVLPGGRIKPHLPSLASVTGWEKQEPALKEPPSPGLIFASRQEYSATLDFSDDDDVDDDDENDDDDEDDDEKNEDADEDEDDVPTINNDTNHALHKSNPNDKNHNNDNNDYSNDFDDNGTPDWTWTFSGYKVNGGSRSSSYLFEKQEEIDWDLEEIRGNNDTPVATITSISAPTSPMSGTPGSTLRRRSSHRKKPE